MSPTCFDLHAYAIKNETHMYIHMYTHMNSFICCPECGNSIAHLYAFFDAARTSWLNEKFFKKNPDFDPQKIGFAIEGIPDLYPVLEALCPELRLLCCRAHIMSRVDLAHLYVDADAGVFASAAAAASAASPASAVSVANAASPASPASAANAARAASPASAAAATHATKVPKPTK
jgi:hypothetical protein